MFNRDNFIENVKYCEYVFNVCTQHGIVLTDDEIQKVANEYVMELRELDPSADESDIEELLFEIIRRNGYGRKPELGDTMGPDVPGAGVEGEKFYHQMTHQQMPNADELDDEDPDMGSHGL